MAERGNYNDRLRDYIGVNERIIEFYAKYPLGSIQSEVLQLTENHVIMKAYAYREPGDPNPGIGHSMMQIPGPTPYTKGSEIENAETSAWGRALAALGFEVKRGIASQQEIENKQQGVSQGRLKVKPDGQGVQGSTQRAPREPKPDSPNKADKVDVMRFWTEVTAALGVEEGRKWMTARMVENDIDPADPKRLDKILQFMLINWRKALAEFQGAPPTDESSGPDIEFETEEEKAHEPL
jgi:hypothetical protein